MPPRIPEIQVTSSDPISHEIGESGSNLTDEASPASDNLSRRLLETDETDDNLGFDMSSFGGWGSGEEDMGASLFPRREIRPDPPRLEGRGGWENWGEYAGATSFPHGEIRPDPPRLDGPSSSPLSLKFSKNMWNPSPSEGLRSSDALTQARNEQIGARITKLGMDRANMVNKTTITEVDFNDLAAVDDEIAYHMSRIEPRIPLNESERNVQRLDKDVTKYQYQISDIKVKIDHIDAAIKKLTEGYPDAYKKRYDDVTANIIALEKDRLDIKKEGVKNKIRFSFGVLHPKQGDGTASDKLTLAEVESAIKYQKGQRDHYYSLLHLGSQEPHEVTPELRNLNTRRKELVTELESVEAVHKASLRALV